MKKKIKKNNTSQHIILHNFSIFGVDNNLNPIGKNQILNTEIRQIISFGKTLSSVPHIMNSFLSTFCLCMRP